MFMDKWNDIPIYELTLIEDKRKASYHVKIYCNGTTQVNPNVRVGAFNRIPDYLEDWTRAVGSPTLKMSESGDGLLQGVAPESETKGANIALLSSEIKKNND
jgi:hypothetical protein